jgi:hypothetical protein
MVPFRAGYCCRQCAAAVPDRCTLALASAPAVGAFSEVVDYTRVRRSQGLMVSSAADLPATGLLQPTGVSVVLPTRIWRGACLVALCDGRGLCRHQPENAQRRGTKPVEGGRAESSEDSKRYSEAI